MYTVADAGPLDPDALGSGGCNVELISPGGVLGPEHGRESCSSDLHPLARVERGLPKGLLLYALFGSLRCFLHGSLCSEHPSGLPEHWGQNLQGLLAFFFRGSKEKTGYCLS